MYKKINEPDKIFKKQRRPIFWAIQIYAYTRRQMYDVYQYGALYTDTDSAFIPEKMYKQLLKDKPWSFEKKGGMKVLGNFEVEE